MPINPTTKIRVVFIRIIGYFCDAKIGSWLTVINVYRDIGHFL